MCFELRASEKCDVYSFGMLLLDVVRRGRNLDVVDIDAASGSNQPYVVSHGGVDQVRGRRAHGASGAIASGGPPPWRGRAAAVQRAGGEVVQGGILVRAGAATSEAVRP
jgi:hypothetical protein